MINRRVFLSSLPIATMALATTITTTPRIASATGLVQFPCRQPLLNTYHFMRAGTSLMEQDDILSTNPLFLTNREAALSQVGITQVKAACQVLRDNNILPSVVKFSFAANAVDSADVIGQELKIGRDRLVPEFFFMDPRAIGKWDMSSVTKTQPAIWAMDVQEAGKYGEGARPPPNEDGTPDETLADQSVRLRQLLSAIESQFSGDTVVLVFPDGSSPALLSAMIAGIPYNQCHELEFQPGEIRLDVTMTSTLELLKTRQQDETFMETYNLAVQEGSQELQKLRSMDPDEVVSLKDQRMEQERIDSDHQLKLKSDEAKRLQEEKARLERQRRIEEDQQRKEQQLEERRYQQQRKRIQQQRQEEGETTSARIDKENVNNNNVPILGGVASVAIVGAVAAAVTGGGEGDEEQEPSSLLLATSKGNNNETAIVTTTNTTTTNITTTGELLLLSTTTNNNNNNNNVSQLLLLSEMEKHVDEGENAPSSLDENNNDTKVESSSSSPCRREEFEIESIQPTTQKVNGDRKALYVDIPPNDPYEAAQKAMEDYMNQDDGTEAWLDTIYEIVNEVDNSDDNNATSTST